jgi:hypothetical protein
MVSLETKVESSPMYGAPSSGSWAAGAEDGWFLRRRGKGLLRPVRRVERVGRVRRLRQGGSSRESMRVGNLPFEKGCKDVRQGQGEASY